MVDRFFAAADIFLFLYLFRSDAAAAVYDYRHVRRYQKAGVLARFLSIICLAPSFVLCHGHFVQLPERQYRPECRQPGKPEHAAGNFRLGRDIRVVSVPDTDLAVSLLDFFHQHRFAQSAGLHHYQRHTADWVYGFVRFWPKTVPGVLSYFMIILEIVCVISMVFIALIGLINKDIQYKIFSFMTVGYIIYLLAAFLPTDMVLQNIGYPLFSFLIIAAGLEVLSNHLEKQQEWVWKSALPAFSAPCRARRWSFSFLCWRR